MKNLPEHLKITYPDAVADPAQCVIRDCCRFTILTPELIRIEYAPDAQFEDRATQSVICRRLDTPAFEIDDRDGWLVLQTDALVLRYKKGEALNRDSLTIALRKPLKDVSRELVWRFGEEPGTLGGTRRTLDGVDGAASLGDGVCSIHGFARIDDSASSLISPDGAILPRRSGIVDQYFFGYGRDYRRAVRDLFRLTGPSPLLPAYAFGNWWSRYHAYTQQEYQALIQRFIREDIPFSVTVIDMDWHVVALPEGSGSGWTGFSWNRDLFPDYKSFLKWLHQHNYRVSLNLHPAQGIRAHEEMYEQAALFMGMDPKQRRPIPFEMQNENFIRAYFEILLHPYEQDGVDFWWMDWQQDRSADGIDPLWHLSHYHTLDIQRSGKRPFFFSRFAGVGSQRFPIGFSGDTLITWASLDFQPRFTATASNIAYPWWSHDIGGHYGGRRDDHLMVRWVQLGVFSPINRLHSSNNTFISKEPWNYAPKADRAIRKFLKLRHCLFPYLYTMNRRTQKDLLPLIEPLYWHLPDDPRAYRYLNEYFFGSQMLVFPITTPSDPVTGLGRSKGLLPPGLWFDFFTGSRYRGNRVVTFYRTLEDYPVLCPAGALVPLMPHRTQDNTLGSRDELELRVFPGADGRFVLYEDAGEGTDYEKGAFCETEFTLHWGKTARLTLHPATGDRSLIPSRRSYTLHLCGFHADVCCTARVNGKPYALKQISDSGTVMLFLEKIPTDAIVEVDIAAKTLLADDSVAAARRIHDLLLHSQTDNGIKERLWTLCCREDLCVAEKIQGILSESPEGYLAPALTEQLTLSDTSV